MSSPSTTVLDALPRETSTLSVLAKPFEALGFWAAIALPFLYVPLLATGVQDASSQLAALVLIGLHVGALLLGHKHRAEE